MIVQMKRLTLVAHKSDEQALLNALQPLGAVEVIPDTEETRDQSMLDAAQSEVDRLSDALTILKPYGKKGGLLSAAPEASLQEIKGKIPEALQLSSELEILQKDLQAMKKSLDVNEVGGTALVGISKPVIKAHGSSNETSFFAAIRQAVAFVESGIIGEITEHIDDMKLKTE